MTRAAISLPAGHGAGNVLVFPHLITAIVQAEDGTCIVHECGRRHEVCIDLVAAAILIAMHPGAAHEHRPHVHHPHPPHS